MNTGNINCQRHIKRQDNSIGENLYFIGKTPELDAVLGLMSERLNKGISFEIFQEWLINFIHQNLTKEEDVVILVLDIQDTLESFKGNNCPADPNGEDKKPICMNYW